MKRNIKREMSLVSFSFHDFITWGTNDVVVSTAAVNPISVIPSHCITDIITYYRRVGGIEGWKIGKAESWKENANPLIFQPSNLLIDIFWISPNPCRKGVRC